MFVIWGWRQYVQTVAMLTFVCGQCGNPSAHALRRYTTKFTLFFIPLFPVHRRHEVQCTFCGATGKVSREQATAMQQQAGGMQPAAPQPPVQQPAHMQATQPPVLPPGGPAAPHGQSAPQPGWPAPGR